MMLLAILLVILFINGAKEGVGQHELVNRPTLIGHRYEALPLSAPHLSRQRVDKALEVKIPSFSSPSDKEPISPFGESNGKHDLTVSPLPARLSGDKVKLYAHVFPSLPKGGGESSGPSKQHSGFHGPPTRLSVDKAKPHARIFPSLPKGSGASSGPSKHHSGFHGPPTILSGDKAKLHARIFPSSPEGGGESSGPPKQHSGFHGPPTRLSSDKAKLRIRIFPSLPKGGGQSSGPSKQHSGFRGPPTRLSGDKAKLRTRIFPSLPKGGGRSSGPSKKHSGFQGPTPPPTLPSENTLKSRTLKFKSLDDISGPSLPSRPLSDKGQHDILVQHQPLEDRY